MHSVIVITIRKWQFLTYPANSGSHICRGRTRGPKIKQFFGHRRQFGQETGIFSAKQVKNLESAENQVFSRPFGEKRLKNPDPNVQSQTVRTGKGKILYGMSKIRQFVQEKANTVRNGVADWQKHCGTRRWPYTQASGNSRKRCMEL